MKRFQKLSFIRLLLPKMILKYSQSQSCGQFCIHFWSDMIRISFEIFKGGIIWEIIFNLVLSSNKCTNNLPSTFWMLEICCFCTSAFLACLDYCKVLARTHFFSAERHLRQMGGKFKCSQLPCLIFKVIHPIFLILRILCIFHFLPKTNIFFFVLVERWQISNI